MLPAIRVLCIGVVSAALSAGIWNADQSVLDLSTKAPEPSGIMPFPGSSAGGIVGGKTPIFKTTPHFELPLTANIKNIESHSGSETEFVVRLLLTNVSSAPILIPASRDRFAAHHAGNRHRTTLVFEVKLGSSSSQDIQPKIVGVVDGSTSDPKTLIELEPNHSVTIFLPLELDRYRRSSRMSLQIVCSEELISDTSYSIEAVSEEVRSNIITIEPSSTQGIAPVVRPSS
jgi:hypothetical protein